MPPVKLEMMHFIPWWTWTASTYMGHTLTVSMAPAIAPAEAATKGFLLFLHAPDMLVFARLFSYSVGAWI